MPEVPSAAATLPIYTGDSFLDRLGLPAIRLDQELTIRHANPAACALLGVAERDIRGQSVFRLVCRTTANSEHFQKRREGQSEVYEVELRDPARAKEAFQDVLHEKPDDARALDGLARLATTG